MAETSDIDISATSIEAPTNLDDTTTSISKKRRNRPSATKTPITQFTLRDPSWAYIHLQHLTSTGPSGPLDAVTAHLHLTAALTQFLGLHGAAIPIDILKISGAEIWIRVPQDDKAALIAAAGGWVSAQGEGWRVRGTSSWDARAVARDGGQDLFDD